MSIIAPSVATAASASHSDTWRNPPPAHVGALHPHPVQRWASRSLVRDASLSLRLAVHHHLPTATAVPHHLPPATAVPHHRPSATAVPHPRPPATAASHPRPRVTAVHRPRPPATTVHRLYPLAKAVHRPRPLATLAPHPRPVATAVPQSHPLAIARPQASAPRLHHRLTRPGYPAAVACCLATSTLAKFIWTKTASVL